MKDPLPERPPVSPRRSITAAVLLFAFIAWLASKESSVLYTFFIMMSLIVIVMLHEAGHFFMAKRAGMKVTEFFVGFGPRIWSFRRGETEYGIKAIPAGGYVRIIGMHNLEKVDPVDESRTYRQAAFRHRFGVAVAGSTVHFILAIILGFFLLWQGGISEAGTTISEFSPGLPAADSDLMIGDEIIQIDDQKITEWEDVPNYIRPRGGEEMDFVVKRISTDSQGAATEDRVEVTLTVGFDYVDGEKVGMAGVAPDVAYIPQSPATAAREAVVGTAKGAKEIIALVGKFFTPDYLKKYGDAVITGEADAEVNDRRFLSPVGATRVAHQAVKSDWRNVIGLLAVINISLGTINLMPFLPLDGGHVVIACYEKLASLVRKKRVHADVTKFLPVTAVVIMLLAFLGATSIFLDLSSPLESPF